MTSRNLVVERLSSVLLTCSWWWHVQYETTNVRCQKTVTCCLLKCATQTPVMRVLFLNMVLRIVLVSWLFLQECRTWHSTEPVTAQRASRVLLSPQWFSVHAFPARQRNVFCFWCDIVRGSFAGDSRQLLSNVVIFNYFACENTITGDLWLKTRSQICLAGRSVNLRLAELNRIRGKWILAHWLDVQVSHWEVRTSKAVRRCE